MADLSIRPLSFTDTLGSQPICAWIANVVEKRDDPTLRVVEDLRAWRF